MGGRPTLPRESGFQREKTAQGFLPLQQAPARAPHNTSRPTERRANGPHNALRKPKDRAARPQQRRQAPQAPARRPHNPLCSQFASDLGLHNPLCSRFAGDRNPHNPLCSQFASDRNPHNPLCSQFAADVGLHKPLAGGQHRPKVRRVRCPPRPQVAQRAATRCAAGLQPLRRPGSIEPPKRRAICAILRAAMRVLYVTTEFPWPSLHGGRVRSLSQLRLLLSLPQVRSLRLFSLAEVAVPPADQQALAAALGQPGKLSVADPVWHPIHLRQHRRYFVEVALRRVLHGLPYLLGKWVSRQVEAALVRELTAKDQAEGAPWDVVYIDHLAMAVYLPIIRRLCPAARVVLECHNVESEFFAQFAAAKPLPLRLVARREAELAAQHEARLVAAACRCCSPVMSASPRRRSRPMPPISRSASVAATWRRAISCRASLGPAWRRR